MTALFRSVRVSPPNSFDLVRLKVLSGAVFGLINTEFYDIITLILESLPSN
jgi:hypothetical protein